MTKFIIKNIANSQTITHDSDAKTWGELSQEIEEIHGSEVVRPGMKAVLRSNRNELSSHSTLPNEGEVKINLFATKLDAGS